MKTQEEAARSERTVLASREPEYGSMTSVSALESFSHRLQELASRLKIREQKDRTKKKPSRSCILIALYCFLFWLHDDWSQTACVQNIQKAFGCTSASSGKGNNKKKRKVE